MSQAGVSGHGPAPTKSKTRSRGEPASRKDYWPHRGRLKHQIFKADARLVGESVAVFDALVQKKSKERIE
ncbi:hypothetical protein HYQ46_004209 [Verticillium longisporum]|nr:hypothetical protein HYQ46_004209 [Verticillium longisporum]